MSLDVYLNIDGYVETQPKIHIREGGRVKAISVDEWNERNPDKPAAQLPSYETTEVFSANITHNLREMAMEAGIYKELWRPEELGFTIAKQLIGPLSAGLTVLKSDPERFRKFNPENAWGDYEGLVLFVEEYLEACKTWPEARISTWR